ncbi:MAG: hypothetical protein M1818_000596 [Claussenomyces sp. TS43310]|nr:MAG: hypothetical protein M1818_000596 [Claussenomyces sp. TS43310]
MLNNDSKDFKDLASARPVSTLATTFQPTAWGLFNKVWASIIGNPADRFDFVPSQTPVSTLTETFSLIVLYYAIVLGGREWMRDRKPYRLNGLFMAHNLILTVISGSLLTLFAGELVPTLWQDGLYENICGASGWTRPLVTLYYVVELFDHVELIDTVFLFLKKKRLTFLHCYHHPATALLCFNQLVGHTSVSWVPITLNLFVHVVMYWYYFQSARGVKIWWKEWITRLPIAQFVVDLGFIYFASWDYFASTYYPSLPHVGTCAGEPFAAITGCLILSSYLVLFIGFYLTTYKKAGMQRHVRAAAIGIGKSEVSTVPETVDKLEEAVPELLNRS